MNGTFYALIGGALFVVLVALGSFDAGKKVEGFACVSDKLTKANEVLVQQQVIIKEVPKIVTRVVTVTNTIEKEYKDATKEAATIFDPSCNMPPWWGELFNAAANGADLPDPRGTDARPAAYGCRETATATLKDLSAGSRNTEQLRGLILATKLMNKGEAK